MFLNRSKKSNWACTKCSKFNYPDVNFCEFCGHPRQAPALQPAAPASHNTIPDSKCPVCGAIYTGDVLFCVFCGASLKSKTPPTIPVQEIAPEPPKHEENIKCLHCGSMNPTQNRFCTHCSEEIRVAKEKTLLPDSSPEPTSGICPECGIRFSSEISFCNECGAKLTISR